MKFAPSDLLVRARNGSETLLETIVLHMSWNKVAAVQHLQTYLVGGRCRRTGRRGAGWGGWDGSKAQALGHDVQVHQALIF